MWLSQDIILNTYQSSFPFFVFISEWWCSFWWYCHPVNNHTLTTLHIYCDNGSGDITASLSTEGGPNHPNHLTASWPLASRPHPAQDRLWTRLRPTCGPLPPRRLHYILLMTEPRCAGWLWILPSDSAPSPSRCVKELLSSLFLSYRSSVFHHPPVLQAFKWMLKTYKYIYLQKNSAVSNQ